LASIAIPTVILAAGADTITPLRDVERIDLHCRASRLITIDNARHELLQESDRYREQALAAIEAFIPGSDAEAKRNRLTGGLNG
jgi:lysophospholipase